MKLLLIALFAIGSTFAAEVELNHYRISGVKRNLSLQELGTSVEGYGGYVSSRIIVQGGDPKDKAIIIVENIYKPDVNERYKFFIGFETHSVFMASGNIKTLNLKEVTAIDVYFSGKKREMFEGVFNFVEQNKDILTGEVRFIVDPFTSTNPYYISGVIQYIKK